MSDSEMSEPHSKRSRIAKSPVIGPAMAYPNNHMSTLAIRNILSDTTYPPTASFTTPPSKSPPSSISPPPQGSVLTSSIALGSSIMPHPSGNTLFSQVLDPTKPDLNSQNMDEESGSQHSIPSGSSSQNKSSSSTPTGVKQKATRNPRAARACFTCRKQKTRCFPAQTSRSCFRCLSLGLSCSLSTEEPEDIFPRPAIPEGLIAAGNEAIERKLDGIKVDVSQVLELLRDGYRLREEKAAAGITNESTLNYLPGTNPFPNGNGALNKITPANFITPSFGYCSHSYKTSPFHTFGYSVRNELAPPPVRRLLNPQMVKIIENVITLNLLTRAETIRILDLFRNYYNQWVSFPADIDTETLLDLMLTRSSLLLTVCCAIVIRYHEPELKQAIWKSLISKLHSDLKATMLIVPHTIEFIQALAIMSIYASSLSDDEDVIDAWFISSIGLQHFMTKDTLGLVISFDGGESPVTAMDEITAYRVWNHLCLVHIVNCNLSGRMLVLDEIRLNQSRRTLELRACSNFDGRMVAEINLQVLIYKFIEYRQSLEEIEEELKLWHNDWGYLFEQPTTQFVETGYHFCYFLVLYHWGHRQLFAPTITQLSPVSDDVSRVFESMDSSTLRRMIRHGLKVLDGVLVVKDLTYFMALSDQVHFFGAHCAVMLARLVITAQSTKPDFSSNTELVTIVLRRISALAEMFKRLDNGQNSLAARYATSITETSQALFGK